ncbi:uncharacterized protein PAE49_021241 [Odontesthes bonariensis]|uniref:uncharacterized protein LOC142369382 n=1 Tax=Odontesthes bonariensis TaxID=219752 RepID=UPI003F586213
MRIFILITALFLCSLSWICGSHTVEVQSGEDVTLLCSNISTSQTQTDWFRVVNGTEPSCIASTFGAHGEASFCDGFQGGKFEMSSNITTVFLKIKRVDFSDSGLYFCGFYMMRHIVLVSAAELIVPGDDESDEEAHLNPEKDGETNVLTLTLGSLTVFLMTAVVGLVVKIGHLHTEAKEELNPDRSKTPGSSDMNSATQRFLKQTKGSRRPADERALETHVIYAFSRKTCDSV